MAASICNDLVFEVNNDGVTGDSMASIDVGGTEEVIAEDVVSDDGVDVGGAGGEDLDLPTGNGLTLMSDQHKCARHIYEGFRNQFSGVQFRGLFRAASKASYPELFKKIMDKIKRANPNAHQYLIKKDSKTWSKAFFRTGSNCNEGDYVGANEHFEAVDGSMDRFWHVIPAGENLFEVRNGSEAFKVDESLRTCSCRIWKLSGIACPHAVAIIFRLNRWAGDYLPDYFRKEMYIQAYSQYLTPVDGMSFWPECEKVVKPPKPPKKKGRPKKTSVEEPHIVDVSDILAFVNVADVEGSNTPEVEVDNVGHVRWSSVANRVKVTREIGGSNNSRVKLVQMRGGAGKKGQISRGRPRFKRLSAWFRLNHGDMNTSNENQNSDLVHEPENQKHNNLKHLHHQGLKRPTKQQMILLMYKQHQQITQDQQGEQHRHLLGQGKKVKES
nr:hypothetical protein [Tanacetum cinerariifolium]